MTDFVIVAVAAAFASTSPAPATVVPAVAPTIGFIVYKDAISCEEATARLVAPPGKRLVCVPVEPLSETASNAH